MPSQFAIDRLRAMLPTTELLVEPAETGSFVTQPGVINAHLVAAVAA